MKIFPFGGDIKVQRPHPEQGHGRMFYDQLETSTAEIMNLGTETSLERECGTKRGFGSSCESLWLLHNVR